MMTSHCSADEELVRRDAADVSGEVVTAALVVGATRHIDVI
jgi:hypothetical protein